MREVKTRAFGIHQAAFLLHVGAQHFAQSLVHQMRHAVIAHGGCAQFQIHLRRHVITDVERALGHFAMVTKHIGLDFLRVANVKAGRATDQRAFVADLATTFSIKGRGVQHHHAGLAGIQSDHGHAIEVQRNDLGFSLQAFVTDERIARTGVIQRAVHLELTGSTSLRLLLFHRHSKTGFVNAETALAANVSRQIQRETVGVVQLEGDLARQHGDATHQGRIKNLHADGQRFKETLFFSLQNIGDALFIGFEAWVSVTHLQHQVSHQLVEKRCLFTQLVAVTNRPSNDAALHIATAFVGWHDTVADQKCGGANVIGNDEQGLVAQVGLAGFACSGLDQRVKNIDFVVAVNMLKNGGQTLQPHAGVDARRRQRFDRAVRLHVELHEHVVPNLNVAVTVLVG